MATLSVVNIENIEVETVELSDAVFAAADRPYLLTEIVNWQRAKKRAGTQSALTKGEVNGSVKKPFAQKGRGCARQGSMKNPHQIGGGVAFAPKPRDYSFKMPKAKKRAALAGALSARVRENRFRIVDALPEMGKTKDVKAAIESLGYSKVLIVDCANPGLKKNLRNLDGAKYLEDCGLNVMDILRFPQLVMTKRAALAVEAKLLGEIQA